MTTGCTVDNIAERKHVFVVNGDPAFLELVRELLQLLTYNVTTSNFIPRTFDQIEASSPDLVIVDLAIGEQRGWELLEQLEHETVTRKIPVIAVSTDAQWLERAHAQQARYGADRYIVKPMDIDDLVTTVRDLIGPE